MTARSFVTDDGVRLAYDDHGPADGTPIVLCHGLAAAAAQFAADAGHFAGLGFRVLTPDLRGHGRSEAPPLRAASYAISRMARDQVLMLDDAGIARVHWVGNSLGGIVALSLLGTDAERLMTLATFGTAYSLRLPRIGGHRIVPFAYQLFGRRLVAAATARGVTRDGMARQLIARLLREADPEVTGIIAGVLTRYDLIANARAATLPILMLRGGRDAQVNAALGPTLWAMAGRENFTLVGLPDGGHCANLDATDAWRVALLAFWDRAVAREAL